MCQTPTHNCLQNTIILFKNVLSVLSTVLLPCNSTEMSAIQPHQYGLKKREEAEAEAAAAAEEPAAGSLTRPKKAVPTGCGDEEEEESIMDTVMKYLPGPLQDMLKK